jgi:hypothetical protein
LAAVLHGKTLAATARNHGADRNWGSPNRNKLNGSKAPKM